MSVAYLDAVFSLVDDSNALPLSMRKSLASVGYADGDILMFSLLFSFLIACKPSPSRTHNVRRPFIKLKRDINILLTNFSNRKKIFFHSYQVKLFNLHICVTVFIAAFFKRRSSLLVRLLICQFVGIIVEW